MVNYINTLSDLLANGLVNLISDIISVLVTLIFMFAINWQLTLDSLALIPVLVLWAYLIQKKQRQAFRKLSDKQSNLNAYIHESIAGIKVTQGFAQEANAIQTFDAVADDNRRAYMQAVKIQYALGPGVQNISTITTALIYFIGIQQLGVVVSTGTLIAFLGYINNFWNPYLMKIAIDTAIPNRNLPLIWALSGTFLISLVIAFLCFRYRIWAITEIGQSLLIDMRTDLFTHLQELPFAYF
ncbi:hypothetical protein WP50_11725, partial [Lactiplantibacillus plantarum]